MKNVPKVIFLQVDADGETPEDFEELYGVSWCADKINQNDIEYVLRSAHDAQIASLEKRLKELGETTMEIIKND